MPKCLNCGFLTLLLPDEEVFWEAPQQFRESGYWATGSNKGVSSRPRCFVRAFDLSREISTRRVQDQDTETLALLHTIHTERNCLSFTPWFQGFSPKEHREMNFHEEVRIQQRRHENLTLRIALIATGISVVGIVVGALINLYAAKIEADATRDGVQTQVEALNRQTAEQIKAQRELIQMQIEGQKIAPPPSSFEGDREEKPASTPN